MRLGSLSFGISKDSAPINSESMFSADTFYSILSLRELLHYSTYLDSEAVSGSLFFFKDFLKGLSLHSFLLFLFLLATLFVCEWEG